MGVDFSGPEVNSIELAFEAVRPGGWRRLDAAALDTFIRPRAGWVLSVPAGQFAASKVDQLYVLIDTEFPASEPRIVSPSLELGEWPHVEPGGLLCLPRTSWAAPPGDRVLRALADAGEVLDLSEAERTAEFAREFGAYWAQLLSTDAPPFIALMAPNPPDAEIFFARLERRNLIVLSDNEATLRQWLENSGRPTTPERFRRTRLRWLPHAWVPSQFPRRVSDVIAAFDPGALHPYLRTGESLPIIFGGATPTGNVFVGVDIPALPRKQFRKGFRPSATVPGATLAAMSAGREVRRCRVERGDSVWVHGRGQDPYQTVLAEKHVGLIGCGALGSALARFLAQMGVGHLVLIDGDKMTSANPSRHLLGAASVGENKAIAVGGRLQRDFPELARPEVFSENFQNLSEAQLERLSECALVISAGITWAGDVALDRWRRALTAPPVHLCTWAEEFAVAGHAVALFGADSIAQAISPDGIPHIRLTDWPPAVRTQIVEAGCGNTFQPHGAVDLSDCVTLAARLAIDVLTSATVTSCRRAWLGDRAEVLRLGGEPRLEFDVSNARKAFPWPP